MEMKEAERVVIAKPVASRPSCSGFRTFTELLTKSANVSPQKSGRETVVAAVKPKTVRFRPTGNNVGASPVFPFPRKEVSGDVNGKLCDDPGTTDRNYVVYKPKAKLVSKATISALANMLQGRVSVDPLKPTEVSVQTSSQNTRGFQNHRGPNLVQRVPTFAEAEAEAKSLQNSTGDRSCLDGYNWRKYGQKHVKGSECPRSYYKCTHPNCPVKKKVERSVDGQISEIVYQSEHNHPKPCLPPRRISASSGSLKLGHASEGSIRQDPVVNPMWRNHLRGRHDLSEGRVENRRSVGVSTPYEFAVASAANSAAGTSDSCCRSGECDESSKGGFDGELDDPKSKRRKNAHQTSEAGVSEDGSRGQPQGSVDSDALEDGFRWRKYGQKVVGGNPFPRSYYRCTSPNCRARKHVERASDDPRAFITTYEGKHNHQMPFRPREDSK